MTLFLIDSLTVHLDESKNTSELSGHVSFSVSSDLRSPASLAVEVVTFESAKLPSKPVVTHTRSNASPVLGPTIKTFSDGIVHGSYQFPFKISIPDDSPSSVVVEQGRFRCSVSTRIVARLESTGRVLLKDEVELLNRPFFRDSIIYAKGGEVTAALVSKKKSRCCCLHFSKDHSTDKKLLLSTDKTAYRPGDRMQLMVGAINDHFSSGVVRLVRVVEVAHIAGAVFSESTGIFWLRVNLPPPGGDNTQRVSVDMYVPQNVQYVSTKGAIINIRYAVEFRVDAEEFKNCVILAPVTIPNF